MPWRRPITSTAGTLLLSLLTAGLLSCNPTALGTLVSPQANFINQGQTGERAVQVGFINNTPFRAIFTFGAYNQLDQGTIPTGFRQLRLEGGTSSAQITQPCRKTFSVGGAELIRLLNSNENDPNIDITDPEALVTGVYFSAAPLGDPLEAEPTEGTALPSIVLNGIDFSCARTSVEATTGTGLLIFTFEQDVSATGGFRIDYEFFLP